MPLLKSKRSGSTFYNESGEMLLRYKSGGSKFIAVYQIYAVQELF
jgi:hypothetical protein